MSGLNPLGAERPHLEVQVLSPVLLALFSCRLDSGRVYPASPREADALLIPKRIPCCLLPCASAVLQEWSYALPPARGREPTREVSPPKRNSSPQERKSRRLLGRKSNDMLPTRSFLDPQNGGEMPNTESTSMPGMRKTLSSPPGQETEILLRSVLSLRPRKNQVAREKFVATPRVADADDSGG